MGLIVEGVFGSGWEYWPRWDDVLAGTLGMSALGLIIGVLAYRENWKERS